jgi:hypothetical protein
MFLMKVLGHILLAFFLCHFGGVCATVELPLRMNEITDVKKWKKSKHSEYITALIANGDFC